MSGSGRWMSGRVGALTLAVCAGCASKAVSSASGSGSGSTGSGGSSSVACVVMGSCYGSVACPVGSVCEEDTFQCCQYQPGGSSSGGRSSSSSHSSSSSRGGSSSGGSSTTSAAPHAATGCSATALTATLNTLSWNLPCWPHSGAACDTQLGADDSAVLQGIPGESYLVTLQFKGIVELRDYGVANPGMFVDGGDSSGDESTNIYELAISSPEQTYFLNNGISPGPFVWVVDYQATVPMNAGATVSLVSNSVDYIQLSNVGPDGGPVNAPGEPAAFDDYDGEWAVMTVSKIVDEGPAQGGVGSAPTCAVANGGCDANALCTGVDAGVTCACRAGLSGDGCNCQSASRCLVEDVAGGLDVRLDLPCTSSGYECATVESTSKSFTVGGPVGAAYAATLHVRGLVEEKGVVGGTGSGFFNVGGKPYSDSSDVFSITVSDPIQTYYLNAGAGAQFPVALDYSAQIPIAGGAQVILSAETIDGLEVSNQSDYGVPQVVGGLSPFPAPFNGQFLQVDVETVLPLDAGATAAGVCSTDNGGCDPAASCTEDAGVIDCACGAGSAGDGCSCFAVGGNLTGLRWQEPCDEVATPTPTSVPATCSLDAGTVLVQTVTMAGGSAGASYALRFHFRGAVEEKTYSGYDGGVDGGLFIAGGTPASDMASVYELDISSPPQTYHLNSGTSNLTYCVEADYFATVQADTGAVFTLTLNPIDAVQNFNYDIGGNPIGIDGVPPYPQTYNGQFLQMDLVSVAPGP